MKCLNVRTLKTKETLMELEEAFLNSKLDIIGLSETRRGGEQVIETKLRITVEMLRDKKGWDS